MISSVAVLIGVRQFAYALALLHIVQSAIYDNPLTATTPGQYDTKLRSLAFDVSILGALLMVAEYKLKPAAKVENKRD